MTDNEQEPRVVVNDKRRIDPETGAVRGGFSPFGKRGPAAADPGDPTNASQPLSVTADSAELEASQQESAERLADLQRVTAEYANYRKRVDRDRQAVVDTAKGQVLTQLLTVLDDIDRAETHGDLTGAFKTVADKLVEILTKQGLTQFATVGDVFDPARHEAVHFATSSEVSEQVVSAVMRHGYALGDRVVRPAVVAVTGPGQEEEDMSTDPGSSGGHGGVAPDGAPTVESSEPPPTQGHPIPDGKADPNAAPGDSGGAGGVGPDGIPHS